MTATAHPAIGAASSGSDSGGLEGWSDSAAGGLERSSGSLADLIEAASDVLSRGGSGGWSGGGRGGGSWGGGSFGGAAAGRRQRRRRERILMTERGEGRASSRATGASGATTTGGALGTGLLILGAALGSLIMLWLLLNLFSGQISAGGLLFALIFAVPLVGALIGAGWYLRQRGATEQAEASVYSTRQGVLDNDRVVRRELARELEQRAAGLERTAGALPAPEAGTAREVAGRLREVMQDVQAPGYDASTWLEQTASRMDASQLQAVRRYDDLVLEEARRLEGTAAGLGRDPQAAQRLESEAALLSQHVREREALLGRAERRSGMAPQEILAAGVAPRRRLSTPLELGLEDAVTYQLDDYVVRGIVTYFAGAREWRTYQLHDGKQERWLEVRGNGAEVGWYELQPRSPGAGTEGMGGAEGAQETKRTESADGAQPEGPQRRPDRPPWGWRAPPGAGTASSWSTSASSGQTGRAWWWSVGRTGRGCSPARPSRGTTSTYGQNQRSSSRLPLMNRRLEG